MDQVCLTNLPEMLLTGLGVAVMAASAAANVVSKLGKDKTFYGKLIHWMALNLAVKK